MDVAAVGGFGGVDVGVCVDCEGEKGRWLVYVLVAGDSFFVVRFVVVASSLVLLLAMVSPFFLSRLQ